MKKIGYTTGVFDMFHIGHLNILKKAKNECDFLIVGLTVDEEVFRVKNKNPIIPYKDRKEILESIIYVDKVVPEFDTNKILAWNELKFNIIFKGSDWKNTAIWNRYEEFFKEKNVEVRYFDYTPGISSTKLRLISGND